MMQVEIDGDRIGAEELVFLSGELASAGVDTTRAQLPLILNAFLDHPQEWDKLRADPGLAGRAVDEGMRFAPLPWVIPHRATRDMIYRDIAFAEGDLACVMVPTTNRDPSATERPDEFIIDRATARHFAFGADMHSCPGASGQDGNVVGASRFAGGIRGHSAGRAAEMGAGSGRPHTSPAGHHDQGNETVARMIGKSHVRRKIWRILRMDQPAKLVIRFF